MSLKELPSKTKAIISSFDDYVQAGKNKFSGPSLYFHYKTLACKQDDPLFIDYLYATLTAWGMHRMGNERNRTQLVDIKTFSENIEAQKPLLKPLLGKSLLDKESLNYGETIYALIQNMNVGIGATKLISGSKALHHLLPDLIPPIDRRYTVRFVYGYDRLSDRKKEAEIFNNVFAVYYEIAQNCSTVIRQHIRKDRKTRVFNTSITKVIDNAVIGYVRKHLDPVEEE